MKCFVENLVQTAHGAPWWNEARSLAPLCLHRQATGILQIVRWSRDEHGWYGSSNHSLIPANIWQQKYVNYVDFVVDFNCVLNASLWHIMTYYDTWLFELFSGSSVIVGLSFNGMICRSFHVHVNEARRDSEGSHRGMPPPRSLQLRRFSSSKNHLVLIGASKCIKNQQCFSNWCSQPNATKKKLKSCLGCKYM